MIDLILTVPKRSSSARRESRPTLLSPETFEPPCSGDMSPRKSLLKLASRRYLDNFHSVFLIKLSINQQDHDKSNINI